MNPLLVTMHGPQQTSLQDLSNFEAGLVVLSAINHQLPGVTWDELLTGNVRSVGMSGWEKGQTLAGPFDLITDIGHGFAQVGRTIGGMVSDAVGMVGGNLGNSVRLLTDPQVMDAAAKAAAAYMTGGGSTALDASLGNESGSAGGSGSISIGQQIMDFISGLGSSAKNALGSGADKASIFGIPDKYLPWAAGGAIFLALVFGRKKGRK